MKKIENLATTKKEDEFWENFKSFIENSGRSPADASPEDFKDFDGTFEQLDYCVKNGLVISDFDEWQAVQRVVKHSLDYKSAIAISDILYKNDISIFDCE